jgi:hypothetical protein
VKVTLWHVVLAALAPALHGCAVSGSATPVLLLRTAQMPAWLDADVLDHYRCEEGLLVCDAAGRTAKRFCRCE